MTKYLCSLLLLLIWLPAIKAQSDLNRHSVSVGWGVGSQLGSERFLSGATLLNPRVAYAFAVKSTLSVGFSAGYSFRSETGFTRDCIEGDLLDGNTDRKLTLVPIQAVARYFPLGAGGGRIQPYAGLSGGVQYARFDLKGDLIDSFGISNWAAVVTSDLGVRFYTGDKRFYFDAELYWQYGGNKLTKANLRSIQRWGLNLSVGLSF